MYKDTPESEHPQENHIPDSTPILPLSPADLMNGVASEIDRLNEIYQPIPHDHVLQKLLDQIPVISFKQAAELDDTEKLTQKYIVVLVIETILETARKHKWGLCRNNDFVYAYNGSYWKVLEKGIMTTFLGEAAEKMGNPKLDSRYHKFRDELLKQFLSVANLPKPTTKKGLVLMNFLNGTLEIRNGKYTLREPKQEDFIIYQLPYEYDSTVTCPLFHKFLNTVQPDEKCRAILAEFLAYVFVKTSTLKLEKVLLLYGSGANGKSVFFEIVKAILGQENVSSYGLQSLTNENGYFRSQLTNVLLNYASEINGKLETHYFKALTSGEDIEARLPYKEPVIIRDYAKLMFNCNELPAEVEHTHAFFRRFLIIPFLVTIPEQEQDKELAQKIIAAELPGVLNWILSGLDRLLEQKQFTQSDTVNRQLDDYKRLSDNVRCFMEDEGYQSSTDKKIPLKDLYREFADYCRTNGAMPCASRKFAERLRNLEFSMHKTNAGQVVHVVRNEFK